MFEVFYKGVALSIQEAYSLFLKASLELEEYQVYAHLRRLGYVVLRHRGKYVSIQTFLFINHL